MKIALCVLMGFTVAGCQWVFPLRDACSRNGVSCDELDAADDSTANDSSLNDAAPSDAAPIDTANDAPSDGCTTHQECAAMQSGTCCVDPGPTTGHCMPGTVIATVCVP